MVSFLIPRLKNKDQWDLLCLVVCSYEGVYGQQLGERVTTQLERGVHIPRLGTAQQLQLLVGGKH